MKRDSAKETELFLQTTAEFIDRGLNPTGTKNNGFVLLVFPFGGPEGARTNYVSNGRREDIVSAWRLTGKAQTRRTFFGKIVVQVEESRSHGFTGGLSVFQGWTGRELRWRDATAADIRELAKEVTP